MKVDWLQVLLCLSHNAIVRLVLMVFLILFEDMLLMVTVYIHCIDIFVFYGGKKSNRTWNNIIFGHTLLIFSNILTVCTVLQVTFYLNFISLFLN